MPTRKQDPENKRFCQFAFASSAEYDRGILANLVAARCHRLTDPEEIALLWWLQQVSWRDGGLDKFAGDFLAANRARVGTPLMLRLGTDARRIYSAEETRAVREELPDEFRLQFLLSGEEDDFDSGLFISGERTKGRALFPKSYAASAVVKVCAPTIPGFADTLRRRLLDPETGSPRKGLWNFPDLWVALCEWRQREVDAATGRIVETEVSRLVCMCPVERLPACR